MKEDIKVIDAESGDDGQRIQDYLDSQSNHYQYARSGSIFAISSKTQASVELLLSMMRSKNIHFEEID